jgi:Fe-S-cluster containining protein
MEVSMTQHSLPVVDPARTEFGFQRTVCACRECTRNCQFIPGYLIPADLDRIRRHLTPDEDLDTWASRHLLASPGAKVLRAGRVFRIRTLVPARQADGACRFLTGGGRCAIHAVAPYGCSFFDSHMAAEEADRRSLRGLEAVLEAWNRGDLYAQLWTLLAQVGLRAPAPEIGRQRLRQACAADRCRPPFPPF